MYNYKAEVKEIIMDVPTILKFKSGKELTRDEIISKWELKSWDIEWFKIYIIKDGKEVQL